MIKFFKKIKETAKGKDKDKENDKGRDNRSRLTDKSRAMSKMSCTEDPPSEKIAPEVVRDWLKKTLEKGVQGCKVEFVNQGIFTPPAGVAHPETLTATFKANHPEKNRYKDVMCLETTRVPLIGHSTNYIHANRVNAGTMRLICCQGPKDNTMDDFWWMMWQESCTQIVMLCDVVENTKPKCAQYWPAVKGESHKYGTFTLVKTNETIQDVNGPNQQQIVTSQIEFTNEGCAPRTVFHRHWTHWPDRGAPTDAKALLRLRNTVARCDVGTQVVIHCSAGIGRTGTFALIDLGMTALEHKEPLDVKKVVEVIREQRLHSIQTDLQYLFAYRALLEFICYKWKAEKTSAVEKWLQDYDKLQPK